MKREELLNGINIPQIKNYYVTLVCDINVNPQSQEKEYEFLHETEGVQYEDQSIPKQGYITLQLAEKLANPKVFNIASRPVTLNAFERESELYHYLVANLCEEGNTAKPLAISHIAERGIIEDEAKNKAWIKTNLIIPGTFVKVPCERYLMTSVDEDTRLIKPMSKIVRDLSGGYRKEPATLDWFSLFILEGNIDDAHNLLWAEYQRRVLPYLIKEEVKTATDE